MAGQDELIEPEVVVLEDALSHLLVAADQGRAGPWTHQTDPGPEVRADFEILPGATVQRQHPLLADLVAPRIL